MKRMKKKLTKLMVSILATAMIMTSLPVNMLTAQAEQTVQSEVAMERVKSVSDNNTEDAFDGLSGTFGDKGGFTWSYDENTRSMIVTGEDSGLNTLKESCGSSVSIYAIKVVFQDCIVSGSMRDLLSEMWNVTIVEFNNVDTSNVTDMSNMFKNCWNLAKVDLSGFDTGNVTDMSGMFINCWNLTKVDLSAFDTANVVFMGDMFAGCSKLSALDVSNFDTKKVRDMCNMFKDCSSLSSLDVSSLDTGNVETMQSMFMGCSSLGELDVSNFDTGNVTNMGSMFGSCSGLGELDVSNFDTGKVTDMSYMFSGCSGLGELDVSNFDTGNVTNMESLFGSCSGLSELNVSNFDTGNVTNMSGMFSGCSSLRELNVSNFDTSNVTNMRAIFGDCSSLKELNISKLDTGNVTDMSNMFYGCSGLTDVDVSHFDTANVTNMAGMFSCCSGLINLDISSFVVGNINVEEMFYGCTNLETIETPKSILKGQVIDLPVELYDLQMNVVKSLTTEQCNKTLVKELKKYKLTYHLDGGQNNKANPEIYYEGSPTIIFKAPTKTGYTFNGWYSDRGYKTKITKINTGSTKDMNLYAKWIPNKYTIKFDKNGATSGTMSSLTNRSYGKAYTLSANAYKKTGYTFNGWNTKKNGSGKKYVNKASVKNLVSANKGSITLYAQWKKTNYKITYNLNGGTVKGSNPKSYDVTTKTITLKVPAKNGYLFKGWYKDKNFKKKVTQIKKGSTGDLILYAKWQKESYRITYKLNGGKNSKSNPKKYDVTTKTTKLKAPTKKGYTFKGWYKDKNFKKKVSQIKKGSTGNITLYAKWVKNK